VERGLEQSAGIVGTAMRILLACEFYYPSVGGVQEVMRQIGERLAARGHSVTVATSYLPERKIRELNGVTIAEFRVSGNSVRGIKGDVGAYRRFLLQHEHDVVMVMAAQQWTFDAMVPVLDQITQPKVFIPCGFSGLYEPAYAEYFREMPQILGKFDRLIFNASEYRDINMARDHCLTNISIIPVGAGEDEFEVPKDPGFRSRLGIDENAFVLLTVGRPGTEKGHWEVADGFDLADFHGRGAVLILIGTLTPEPPRGRVRAFARSWVIRFRMRAGRVKRLVLRLPPRPTPREPITSVVARINRQAPAKFAIVTDLPRAELVQAYLNSDLFVFASRVEYSPLVLYEAAAAGLPFLTVPVGNAAEIVEWTGGGVVCPAARDERGYTRVDPAVLAEHMSSLAADPDLRAALGRAGHKAWLARYTWDKITDQYEAIFTDLARKAQS
jgi:glycosyltransferase involved in cell wall biosynthesis